MNLYNTPAHKIEVFHPIHDGQVTLYTCGPTVYASATIGNWMAYIYWDLLVRVLVASDYRVTRVMNITDVGHLVSDADEGQDKLEKGAQREGKTAWQIAEYYTNDFLTGMQSLRLVPPTFIMKATDHISEQLDLIKMLKDKDYTYQITDGIYFDTAKFPRYAEFAGLDLAAQKAGARVEHNAEKRQPSDFALWKFSPVSEKRDMEWATPVELLDGDTSAKMGFPGWHLECSAMALKKLGVTIDIHTGGIDHIPVHHTNEIAQSEAATEQTFVHYWLHNNMLKVDGHKISKSLGNGYILDDLVKKGYSVMDFKFFALQSHYRNEGNFTWQNLEGAKSRLARWREVAVLRWQTLDTLTDDEDKTVSEVGGKLLAAKHAMLEALQDDLNSPLAMSNADEALGSVEQQRISEVPNYALTELLTFIDTVFGLDILDSTPDVSDDIKTIIIDRVRAREKGDWSRSDQLRNELAKRNIAVRDTKTDSTWFYAS